MTSLDSSAPVKAYPVGRRAILLDAWMRNPVEVKITAHANSSHFISEDARGVVYFAHVGRVTRLISEEPAASHPEWEEFSDILG